MQLNLIAFAVPLFVSLMLIEFIVSKKQGKQLFRFPEVIANVNVGIGERLSDLFTTGLFYLFFQWVYEHYRIFTVPSGALSYVLLFIAADFVWYWYHRLGHEINIFWAAHGVHHQSEDFNYTVSARITVFQAGFRCIFWSFLPLLGFHPAAITLMLLIHGAYPFFTHTQVIGKLGWLEYFLVTPSHHRVHHSSNPEYLDTNYGDVLIIWDKLFGTFAKETVKPIYGLTKQLGSYSFLWQHFHLFLETGVAVSRVSGIGNKLRIMFGKPDVIDPDIRDMLEKRLLKRNTGTTPSANLYWYISSQTIFTVAILFFVILFENYEDTSGIWIAAVFILVSVISTGAMLEQKRWVFDLELCRLILAAIYIHAALPYPFLSMSMVVAIVLVVVFYKSLRTFYFNRLYVAG